MASNWPATLPTQEGMDIIIGALRGQPVDVEEALWVAYQAEGYLLGQFLGSGGSVGPLAFGAEPELSKEEAADLLASLPTASTKAARGAARTRKDVAAAKVALPWGQLGKLLPVVAQLILDLLAKRNQPTTGARPPRRHGDSHPETVDDQPAS